MLMLKRHLVSFDPTACSQLERAQLRWQLVKTKRAIAALQRNVAQTEALQVGVLLDCAHERFLCFLSECRACALLLEPKAGQRCVVLQQCGEPAHASDWVQVWPAQIKLQMLQLWQGSCAAAHRRDRLYVRFAVHVQARQRAEGSHCFAEVNTGRSF